MTFASLSREIGVQSGRIAYLAYGIEAPICDDTRRKEKVKKPALAICEYFHLDFAEVFPRYACQAQELNAFEVYPIQTYSELVSDPEYVLKRIEAKELFAQLKSILTSIECEIFIGYVFYNQTYDELSQKYRMPKNRVRQIYMRVIRKAHKEFVPHVRDEYLKQQVRSAQRQEKIGFEKMERIRQSRQAYYKMRKEQVGAKKLQKKQERRKRDFANFVQRVPLLPKPKPRPKPSLPMSIGEVSIEQPSLIPSV